MSTARLTTTLVLVAALVSACVPFPNHWVDAPAVSGTVTRDGSPVAMATVTVSDDLSKRTREATTDAHGRFVTVVMRRFMWTIPLLGDPQVHYSLEIVEAGRHYRGFSNSRYGDAPERLAVRCELSAPVPGRQDHDTPVYCSVLGPSAN